MENTGLCGHVRVGTQLYNTLSTIHPNRAIAFREVIDNGISKGASYIGIDVKSSEDMGARAGIPMLTVITDTYMDVEHAMWVSHTQSHAHDYGTLNQFGLGMRAFPAKLGDHVQTCVGTFDNNKVALARFGSLMDKVVDPCNDAIGFATAYGEFNSNGLVELAWDIGKGSGLLARERFFRQSPWFSEDKTYSTQGDSMCTILKDLRQRGMSKATVFIFYNAYPEDTFPVRVNANESLTVHEMDGTSACLLKSVMHSYIDFNGTMPRITIGRQTVDFAQHPWNRAVAQLQHTPQSYAVYLPDLDQPVASIRYACVVPDFSLQREGAPLGETKKFSPYFAAHREGRDGAFLILDGCKVIAERALFTGTVFRYDDAGSQMNKYLSDARSKGSGVESFQLAALMKYVTCDDPQLVARFKDEYPERRMKQWVGRNLELWPRVGLGTLAVIDVNSSLVTLDPSKTKIEKTAHSAQSLLGHLRYHLFAWAVSRCDNSTFHPPFAEAYTISSPSDQPSLSHSAPFASIHEEDDGASSAMDDGASSAPQDDLVEDDASAAVEDGADHSVLDPGASKPSQKRRARNTQPRAVRSWKKDFTNLWSTICDVMNHPYLTDVEKTLECKKVLKRLK